MEIPEEGVDIATPTQEELDELMKKVAEEKKAKSTTALEKQKVEDTKKLIKASKNDPEKLDQILKDLGIEEV